MVARVTPPPAWEQLPRGSSSTAEIYASPLTAEGWRGRDEPPDTGFRYRFDAHELDAIKACHDTHGFALVERVISPDRVAALRADIEAVCPASAIEPGQSEVRHAFADFSQSVRDLLLEEDKYMPIQRQLLGVTAGKDDHELTVHRSAAIVRCPGAGAGGASSPWHSDFTGYEPLPLTNASVHLNRGEGPNGKWFYLNGSHPRKGGLCVLAGSHRPDYVPPGGFRWSNGPHSGLERLDATTGEWESANNDFDIPGVVPFYSEPGDMLIFAARTMHAAFPVPEDFTDVRHSVGIGLRSTHSLQGDFEGATVAESPWPIPDSARRAIESTAGTVLERYFSSYWGFPGAEPGTDGWSPELPAEAAATPQHSKL